MQDLYCAVGQLYIYDNLEEDDFNRIIVLPGVLDGVMQKTLNSLDITVLTYGMGKVGNIEFNANTLKQILNAK